MFKKLTIFIFSISIFAHLSVSAEETKQDVLHVAFNPLPPWKIIDKQDKHTGIDIEFLKLLAARLNLKLKFTECPFKRGLKMLEWGKADLMTGILDRPERREYLHYLEPCYKKYTNKAFYVLKDSEHIIKKHSDLYKLNVGTQLGTKYYPQFDNDSKITKMEVSSITSLFNMLEAKRFDTFILTEATGDYWLKKHKKNNIIVKSPYVYQKEQGVYIVISKKSPYASRLNDFTKHLNDLLKNGTFEKVKKSFMKKLHN